MSFRTTAATGLIVAILALAGATSNTRAGDDIVPQPKTLDERLKEIEDKAQKAINDAATAKTVADAAALKAKSAEKKADDALLAIEGLKTDLGTVKTAVNNLEGRVAAVEKGTTPPSSHSGMTPPPNPYIEVHFQPCCYSPLTYRYPSSYTHLGVTYTRLEYTSCAGRVRFYLR